MRNTITADFLWMKHRAALGGRSAISGAELPPTLTDCKPEVQASHYGIAVAIAAELDLDLPPVPPGVSEELATTMRQRVLSAG